MAISTTITQPCPHCGQRVDAVLHKSFVIEDEASLRTLLENRFHVLDCASCGERRAFEADFLVTNKPRDMFVQVIQKDADVASMRESFRRMLDDGVTFARIVPGRHELVEKVRLWSQKLDDVAMEVVKFLVRIKIGDKEGKTRRVFDRIEGDDLVFLVRAPGQPVEPVKMPMHVYRDTITDLDTAAHARDYEVDERLARKLLEEKGGMPKAEAPAAATSAAASAPVPDEDRAPCPVCRGLTPRGERFCEACGVCLAWQADGTAQPSHPELVPGRVLVSESFEQRPFPGRTSVEESRAGAFEARVVRGGKMITYQVPITASYVDYARPLRDACVRATFTPLDPGARIGLCARHSILGGMQIYDLFDVMPLAGRAWISRGVQSPEYATSTRLCPEVRIDPVPLGASVELELRVAGSTLRAFVQGRPLLVAHDAAFGSGSFGIRVGREHDVSHPVRIVCHGYEIREVMP